MRQIKASGFVRNLDDLGRLVIPAEVRETMDISKHSPLELFFEGDCMIIRKYQPGCIFTGDMDLLIEYKGKKVSAKAVMDMCNLIKASGYSVG